MLWIYFLMKQSYLNSDKTTAVKLNLKMLKIASGVLNFSIFALHLSSNFKTKAQLNSLI